jgi:hypothetical protein
MTKVLLAIDEEYLKELIIANNYDEDFIADIEREKADAQKMVEALIKEKDKEIEEQKQRAEYHWDRTGNSKVFLLLPNKDNPFYRTECKIADFGVSDNHYIVECDEIEVLIKEAREDEHKKTWDNIKEIYDTTDYKKHIEEAIKETEQRVSQDFIMQCFEADNGNHIISTCELEQLREKYKGVE